MYIDAESVSLETVKNHTNGDEACANNDIRENL